MQTSLPPEFVNTAAGMEADSILRSCVHCGFCNATCPTYQLERNELDGPRGRIYLIKQMLEGDAVSAISRQHLDRCLVCQACETTCPSGVDYHRLLEIGRREIEIRAPRPIFERARRMLLRRVLSRRLFTRPLFAAARLLRPLLPPRLRSQVPALRPALPAVSASHQRRVILVQGCVQPAMSPATNQAAALVLDRLGISAIAAGGETCCGALAWHGGGERQGAAEARRNIDAWWPHLEAGAEAIVMTASGCSNFVGDYPRILADDARYAEKAARVATALRDISQVLDGEDLERLNVDAGTRISWHCPCTAQHGQALDAPTRRVLERLGFVLPAVRDAHLCCGSAGSYSLFQPEMSAALRARKLVNLEASDPELIVTANIGCQAHLAAGTGTPVQHWIELVARSLPAKIQQPNEGGRSP